MNKERTIDGKTLLVTGGAGFIGSNFIRYVLKKYSGARIINLDKLTYAGNLANLAEAEGDGAGGDAGRRLPGARPLRDVPGVGQAELEGAGQVGVAGPGFRDRPKRLPALHPVRDPQNEGAAHGPSLPDPGQDLDRIVLHLLAGAASVPALPAGEVGVDDGGVEREPEGKPLEDGDQAGAVGLAGGAVAQHGIRPWVRGPGTVPEKRIIAVECGGFNAQWG
jgi:hypothetical protein